MKELKEIEKKCNIDLSDLYDKYPVAVGEICDRIGIEVIFDGDMEDDYHGQIMYKNGKYIIRINDNHHLHNNVFTIAHELGHYIKHHEEVKTTGFADRKKTKYNPEEYSREKAANNFAASLLMPSKKFEEVFAATNGNLQALQDVFRVSLDAVKFRALNLGLLLA